MHKTIIITKSQKSSANTFFNSIGFEGETFTIPLYKGSSITHYWAGLLMSDAQWDMIKERNYQFFDSSAEALQSTGLQLPTQEIE